MKPTEQTCEQFFDIKRKGDIPSLTAVPQRHAKIRSIIKKDIKHNSENANKKIEAFIKKSEKDTDERKHDKEILELNVNQNR